MTHATSIFFFKGKMEVLSFFHFLFLSLKVLRQHGHKKTLEETHPISAARRRPPEGWQHFELQVQRWRCQVMSSSISRESVATASVRLIW